MATVPFGLRRDLALLETRVAAARKECEDAKKLVKCLHPTRDKERYLSNVNRLRRLDKNLQKLLGQCDDLRGLIEGADAEKKAQNDLKLNERITASKKKLVEKAAKQGGTALQKVTVKTSEEAFYEDEFKKLYGGEQDSVSEDEDESESEEEPKQLSKSEVEFQERYGLNHLTSAPSGGNGGVGAKASQAKASATKASSTAFEEEEQQEEEHEEIEEEELTQRTRRGVKSGNRLNDIVLQLQMEESFVPRSSSSSSSSRRAAATSDQDQDDFERRLQALQLPDAPTRKIPPQKQRQRKQNVPIDVEKDVEHLRKR